MFWIRGKPGSGKSTIMKYLSDSASVREKLPQSSGRWIIVNFFFDFRQSHEIGNTVQGLLLSLLRQISWHVNVVREKLRQQPGGVWHLSARVLQDLFHETLTLCDDRFLILVDGLDEYLGEMIPLLKFLKSLKAHKRMKLCLASRPEQSIERELAALPVLDMSICNKPGIKRYIESTIQSFQPLLDQLKVPDVQQIIQDRAQGVFLWVHLAVCSVIKGCDNGYTDDEIKEALISLPGDLEQLYQRIIDRIPRDRISEASIIYTLVSTSSTERLSLSLLYSTVQFLASGIGITPLPKNLNDLQRFGTRLNAILGGLVELVSPSKELGNTEELGGWTVQLIHETVRSFSGKSKWHEQDIPIEFSTEFPNYVWPRLASRVLVIADERSKGFLASLAREMRYVHIVYPYFVQLLSRYGQTREMLEWAPLLFHSIRFIIHYSDETADVGLENLESELEAAMRSRLASMHFSLGGPRHMLADFTHPSPEALNSENCDLVLAASHQGFRYLRKKKIRIQGLSDDQRNELVSLMLDRCFENRKTCEDLYNGRYGSSEYVVLQELTDMILSFNQIISSSHLNIFVSLRYERMPRFIESQLFKGSDRFLEMIHTPSKLPRLPAKSDSRFYIWACKPCPTDLPPLFVWACHRGGGDMFSTALESQLSVLLSLGIDINFRDSSGLNVVHYILSKHLIGHIYLESNELENYPNDNMVAGIERLYLVERARADFSYQFEHRTPLQAFRYGVDRVYQTPIESLNLGDPPRHNELSELVRMLEHKEHTGHLPQPYLGRSEPREYFEGHCDICNSDQNPIQESLRTNYEDPITLIPSRSPPIPHHVSPKADQSEDNANTLPDPNTRSTKMTSDVVNLDGPNTILNSSTIPSRTSTSLVAPNGSNGSSNSTQKPAASSPRQTPRVPRTSSASPRYLQPTKSSKQKVRSRYKEP